MNSKLCLVDHPIETSVTRPKLNAISCNKPESQKLFYFITAHQTQRRINIGIDRLIPQSTRLAEYSDQILEERVYFSKTKFQNFSKTWPVLKLH